ncbi:MAG: hypothetical protein U9Q77_12345, partial [Candidatus Marinimicrobia bacterium]|nr:hypothetical protein [Candidatus Neomarinimicrobiota bacterium]
IRVRGLWRVSKNPAQRGAEFMPQKYRKIHFVPEVVLLPLQAFLELDFPEKKYSIMGLIVA